MLAAALSAVLSRSRRAGAAPGRSAPAAAVPAANQAIPLVALTSQARGKFRRVRAVDDDTRLNLSYPTGPGRLTGARAVAPGFYGLDMTGYPVGSHAARYLQDLFDNTPFSFLGFYFTTTGHPAHQGSWSGKARALLANGWNIVPIYVGRQQYWPHTTDNQISSKKKKATAQGHADGVHAAAQASSEHLPHGSKIYLDVEATQYAGGTKKGKNGPPSATTIAYIKAWLAAVKATGAFAGALYDANSRWKVGKTTYYGAVTLAEKLGAKAPATWVAWDPGLAPVGVPVGVWPLDPNGDVAPVGVKKYSKNHQWDFAPIAQTWQFALDWKPTGISFLTDTGAARKLTSIAPRIDLDVSRTDDPGNTAPGRPKARRRPRTSAVTVDSPTVRPGKSVHVTVTLDRPAPAPNGAVVLLRSASPYLIVATSVRVAAHKTDVTVTAVAAEGSRADAVAVRARVLHQLSGDPAHVTVHVAP